MSIALSSSLAEALTPQQQSIERQLSGLRALVRRQQLLEGIAFCLAMIVGLALATLLIDWLFRLTLATRLVLELAAVVVLGVLAIRRLVTPLLIPLGDMDLAILINRHQRGLAQRIAAVLELPRLLGYDDYASPSMIRAAVETESNALAQSDFADALDRDRRRHYQRILLGALAIPLLMAIVAPQTAALWSRRWLLGSNERWPQRTYLSVVGLGDSNRILTPRGEPLLIRVTATPEFERVTNGWSLPGRGARLIIAGDERPSTFAPEQVTVEIIPANGEQRRDSMTRYEEASFRYEVPPVTQPLDLVIKGGDDWLAPIHVVPIDRPSVESIKLTTLAPGKPESDKQVHEENVSQFLFLPNTRVELEVRADVELEGATLVATQGAAPALDRLDEQTFHAMWTHREAVTLEIDLVGKATGLHSNPYYLSIGVLQDRVPRVTIRASGVGRRVTPQARIPLTVRARDDFGLMQVGLEMETAIPSQERSESAKDQIDLEMPADPSRNGPVTDTEQDTSVMLRERTLPAGALLKLLAAASDNCADGPQTGRSRTLLFQIVTPDELFYELLMRQRALRARFRAAYKTAVEQNDQLAREVASEQMPALIRRHQVVARQVWQIAGQLAASLEEMKLNELGSDKTLNLLDDTVIDPMRELHRGTMTDMRETLQQMSRGQTSMSDHLPDARTQQQEIVDSMQRLLERMSQWESFVDVVNQVRELIKMENEIRDSTEKARKERVKKLFDD